MPRCCCLFFVAKTFTDDDICKFIFLRNQSCDKQLINVNFFLVFCPVSSQFVLGNGILRTRITIHRSCRWRSLWLILTSDQMDSTTILQFLHLKDQYHSLSKYQLHNVKLLVQVLAVAWSWFLHGSSKTYELVWVGLAYSTLSLPSS